MDIRRRKLLLGPLVFVVSTLCLADGMGPAVGNFGFDWLRPDWARCEAISEALMEQFLQCEYRSDGAFGLSDPVHACRISEQSEYMIHETERACANNLETMQANAP
jgi:hypothetical protein